MSTPKPLILATLMLSATAATCVAQPAATPAAPVDRSKTPAGWVVIQTQGQKFQFGQEFTGKLWTYTFPVHEVSFTYNFMMDSKQVTQEQYKAVTGENPTLHPGDLQRPIDNVTWFDAVLYCNALSKRDGLDPVYTYKTVKGDAKTGVKDLSEIAIDIKKNGYRLLTSAEYEFVVRAGTTTTYFWNTDDPKEEGQSKDYAWSVLNATDNHTHPVGLLKPNKYGVYDITGNLWMWCNDWYGGKTGDNVNGKYPTDPQVDQTGPAAGTHRIARGGAFKNDVSGHERSAYHWQWTPDTRNYEVGFRIARTIP